MIRYIEEVDNNDELWADIVSAPWQTAEQIEKMKIEDIEYQCFIKKIFMSPNKIMRPAGTFIDVYEEWFYRQYKKPSIVQRSKKKIRRMLEG